MIFASVAFLPFYPSKGWKKVRFRWFWCWPARTWLHFIVFSSYFWAWISMNYPFIHRTPSASPALHWHCASCWEQRAQTTTSPPQWPPCYLVSSSGRGSNWDAVHRRTSCTYHPRWYFLFDRGCPHAPLPMTKHPQIFSDDPSLQETVILYYLKNASRITFQLKSIILP